MTDSISRYDSSRDLFSVGKPTEFKNKPVSSTGPVHKDTLEISHDKLKTEALNRLRHTTKFVIPQNSFMRIGKYLFIAVAFPPYLVLYELPKWVIVEGIPKMFSMLAWMTGKLKQKAEKPLETGTNKVVKLIQFLQKISQNIFINPVVRLTLEIRERLHRMREQAIHRYQAFKKRGLSLLLMPQIKIKEQFNLLRTKISFLGKKVQQQIESLSTKMQEGVQWVKNGPQFFLGWGQTHVQKLSDKAFATLNRAKQQLQNSQARAQKLTNAVFNQVGRGFGLLKTGCEPFVVLYQHILQPSWQKCKQACKSKWNQTKDFFQQKHRKALFFFQEKQRKIKNLTVQQFLDRVLSNRWMTQLPLHLQRKLKKWLSRPTIQLICKASLKVYSVLLTLGVLTLNLLSRSAKTILSTCKALQAYVKVLSYKVFSAIRVGYTALKKVFWYALYYLLLGVMMVAILVIWGLYYLRSYMVYLTAKFSFKNSFLSRSIK